MNNYFFLIMYFTYNKMLSFTSEFLTRKINTKETGLITLKVPDNITINDYNRHTILILDLSSSMRGYRYSTLLASVEYIFKKSKKMIILVLYSLVHLLKFYVKKQNYH